MQKIVGLTGFMGAGKDTVASFLMDAGWVRMAFADALYLEVSQAYGVSVAFLKNRDTKETPLPELALVKCADLDFVAVMCEVVGRELENKAFSLEQLVQTMNDPLSPRRVLQVWGTEYRRRLNGDSYWRDQVTNHIKEHPETNFVITDVRFPDEARVVEALGGTVARVVRPENTFRSATGMLHSSENAMVDYPVEVTLLNEEGTPGLVRLRDQTLAAFESTMLKCAAA